jgi:ABC-type glycerol-3-phosphate transport system substrate-binding protein
MRKIAVAFTLLLVAVSAYSQTKKEDVRALVVREGSGDIGIQVVEALIPEFQKMLPDVPREYRGENEGEDPGRGFRRAYSYRFTISTIRTRRSRS